ncbi:uncharacterized protein LOC141591013 [Silene latifolia]|uniref:uncharacterized protein LOC141591013 n=1 Tax=Silene latifolia TaxID=37657 RepID=UPI003D78268C
MVRGRRDQPPLHPRPPRSSETQELSDTDDLTAMASGPGYAVPEKTTFADLFKGSDSGGSKTPSESIAGSKLRSNDQFSNASNKDEYTTNKSKLAFARVLIEIDISKDLPMSVSFKTPYQGRVEQKIEYEWIPHFCHTCRRIGHTKDKCRAGQRPRMVYPAKERKKIMGEVVVQLEPVAVPVVDVVLPLKTDPVAAIVQTTPPSQHLDVNGGVKQQKMSVSTKESVTTNLGNKFQVLANENHNLEEDNSIAAKDIELEDLDSGGVKPGVINPQ